MAWSKALRGARGGFKTATEPPIARSRFIKSRLLPFCKMLRICGLTKWETAGAGGAPETPQPTWVAPDGQLCDAAMPGCIIYKQGDGRTAIHDWGLEFTAAGVLMQSELLLIGRDQEAIAHYLPLLECAANFFIPGATPRTTCSSRGRRPTCWRRVTRAGPVLTALTQWPIWPGCRSLTLPARPLDRGRKARWRDGQSGGVFSAARVRP